jgi:hypothetical protein
LTWNASNDASVAARPDAPAGAARAATASMTLAQEENARELAKQLLDEGFDCVSVTPPEGGGSLHGPRLRRWLGRVDGA